MEDYFDVMVTTRVLDFVSIDERKISSAPKCMELSTFSMLPLLMANVTLIFVKCLQQGWHRLNQTDLLVVDLIVDLIEPKKSFGIIIFFFSIFSILFLNS